MENKDPITTPPQPIVVAHKIELCRGCGKDFIQNPADIYSAKYYRCPKCTDDKALIRSIMYSCTIS